MHRNSKKSSRTRRTTVEGSPKPSDYALGSLESRAAARAWLAATQTRFQLIVYGIGSPLNLENSTCKRSLLSDGTLFEFVILDGSITGITEEQLDEFTSRSPITPECERNTREE